MKQIIIKNDDRGLTGNTGCVYDDVVELAMHISMPYSCNDGVFVEVVDPEFGLSWERKALKRVKPSDKLIPCCQCGKPATRLDHFYPYYSGNNLCDNHKYNPDICE